MKNKYEWLDGKRYLMNERTGEVIGEEYSDIAAGYELGFDLGYKSGFENGYDAGCVDSKKCEKQLKDREERKSWFCDKFGVQK